jgi:oleate hydratase
MGSLAAVAFMIRDRGLPGENISILEPAPLMSGSLGGAGDSAVGYSMRGGRISTAENVDRKVPPVTPHDKSLRAH